MKKMSTFGVCLRPIHLKIFVKSAQRNLTVQDLKKHMFLYHYGTKQQVGGRGPRMNDLPINILRRGTITYYSITFDQHKNLYHFFSIDVVDSFFKFCLPGLSSR